MSWQSQFTPEEIEEWEELEVNRQRDSKSHYCKYGIPLSRRHREYLDEKYQAADLRRKSQNTDSQNRRDYLTGPRGRCDPPQGERAFCFEKALDGVLRLVARPSFLPHSPSWSRLKHHILQSGLFSPAELEPLQHNIMSKLFRLREAHIGFGFEFEIGGTGTEPSSLNVSRESRDVSFGDGRLNSISHRHGIPSRLGGENLHPSWSCASSDRATRCFRRSRPRSVSMSLNGTWKFLTAEYCAENESFISRRMAQQYDLDMDDGEIWLFWRFHGVEETFLTPFILLDDLQSDFVIGVKASEYIVNDEHVDDTATKSHRDHSEGSGNSSSSATPRNAWMPSLQPEISSRWIPVMGKMTDDTQSVADLSIKTNRTNLSKQDSVCSERAERQRQDGGSYSSMTPADFGHFDASVSDLGVGIPTDNMSVFPSLDSGSSQTSCGNISCPVDELAGFLLADDDLRPLFNKCGKKLHVATFEQNHNTLLKELAENLLREAENALECTIARCLLKSRRRITSEIRKHIYGLNSDQDASEFADEPLPEMVLAAELANDTSAGDEHECDDALSLFLVKSFVGQSSALSVFRTRLKNIIRSDDQDRAFTANHALQKIAESVPSLDVRESDDDISAQSNDADLDPLAGNEDSQHPRPLALGSNNYNSISDGIWSCFIDPPQDVVCIAVIVSFILLEFRRPR